MNGIIWVLVAVLTMPVSTTPNTYESKVQIMHAPTPSGNTKEQCENMASQLQANLVEKFGPTAIIVTSCQAVNSAEFEKVLGNPS